MPSFNSTGDVVFGFSGGGAGPIYYRPRNTANSVLLSRVGSCPRFVSDTVIVYYDDEKQAVLLSSFPYTSNTIVWKSGANWVEGGGSHWAARVQTNPPRYTDNIGTRDNKWLPVACGKAGILVVEYNTGASLSLLSAGHHPILLDNRPIARGDAAMDGTKWVARINANTLIYGENGNKKGTVTIPSSADLAYAHPYIVTNVNDSLVVVNIETERATYLDILDTNRPTYYPDIRVIGAGKVEVVWSITTGEGPSHIRTMEVNTEEIDTELPPPPPPQNPTYFPPLPTPKWILPYHVVTDRWGDDSRPVGNGMIITAESPTESTAVSQARALRAGTKFGLPLVTDLPSYTKQVESLVIGLYLSAPDEARMREQVQVAEAGIQNRIYPDVPLICYVDKRSVEWDKLLPHLNPKRHWISPQLYIDPGERVIDFLNHCVNTCFDVLEGDFKVIPTWCAYDRNGLITPQTLYDIQEIGASILDIPGVIGILPFTDMRQGKVGNKEIGGMNLYPEVKDVMAALQDANPEERPHRWSYWTPRFTSKRDVILSKLSQTRELVHFDEEEKAWLRSVLRS